MSPTSPERPEGRRPYGLGRGIRPRRQPGGDGIAKLYHRHRAPVLAVAQPQDGFVVKQGSLVSGTATDAASGPVTIR